MARPVTLFTGQWADLPLEELAQKAKVLGLRWHGAGLLGRSLRRAPGRREQGVLRWPTRASGQAWPEMLGDQQSPRGAAASATLNDSRSEAFAPKETHGDPEKMRRWAIEEMKLTARAAANLGVKVVNGFTGSSIWHMLYSFPPVSPKQIEAGFQQFADLWNPILDVFDQAGVRFGLEVHPTEIAFDIHTARRALEALKNRPAFGFNFDPSHLIWQGVDPVKFLAGIPGPDLPRPHEGRDHAAGRREAAFWPPI